MSSWTNFASSATMVMFLQETPTRRLAGGANARDPFSGVALFEGKTRDSANKENSGELPVAEVNSDPWPPEALRRSDSSPELPREDDLFCSGLLDTPCDYPLASFGQLTPSWPGAFIPHSPWSIGGMFLMYQRLCRLPRRVRGGRSRSGNRGV
jgi:hypothetical protein